MVALMGLGKAGVIGAGLVLALAGYADLAGPILPADLLAFVENGVPLEAAAGVGGFVGVVVGLIASLLR